MTITFTCPHCGGHKLQQIRRVIHRTEVNISAAPTGELIPAAIGVVEELRGPIQGYRCRDCRYLDIIMAPNFKTSAPKNAFFN